MALVPISLFLIMRIEKSQMDEEEHRCQAGRVDHAIVFRQDHEYELLSDIRRGTNPGYQ